MSHVSDEKFDQATAVVHRGKDAKRAGLQIQINGSTVQGFVVETAHKKRPIRLAVGEPGRRSSIWRFWEHRNASDIYIASAQTADFHKISLHESGDWRYQVIGNLGRITDSPKVGLWTPEQEHPSRVIGSWHRPKMTKNGWVDAMRIVVPVSELVENPSTYGEPDGIRWVSPGRAGSVSEIRLFVVRPGCGPFSLNAAANQAGGVSYWGGFALPSGEVAIVMSTNVSITSGVTKAIRDLKKRHQPANFDSSFEYAPRILAPIIESHYATFWDFCGY